MGNNLASHNHALDAQVVYELSLKLQPTNNPAMTGLSKLLLYIGKTSEAQHIASKALHYLEDENLEKEAASAPESLGINPGSVSSLKLQMKAIVEGRFNVAFYKARLEPEAYEALKIFVKNGIAQRSGKRWNQISDSQAESELLSLDDQRNIASMAVETCDSLIEKEEFIYALRSCQVAYELDEVNLKANSQLAQLYSSFSKALNDQAMKIKAKFHANIALGLFEVQDLVVDLQLENRMIDSIQAMVMKNVHEQARKMMREILAQ